MYWCHINIPPSLYSHKTLCCKEEKVLKAKKAVKFKSNFFKHTHTHIYAITNPSTVLLSLSFPYFKSSPQKLHISISWKFCYFSLSLSLTRKISFSFPCDLFMTCAISTNLNSPPKTTPALHAIALPAQIILRMQNGSASVCVCANRYIFRMEPILTLPTAGLPFFFLLFCHFFSLPFFSLPCLSLLWNSYLLTPLQLLPIKGLVMKIWNLFFNFFLKMS